MTQNCGECAKECGGLIELMEDVKVDAALTMTTNVEVKQIDVEYALHDVMDNICKYLKAKDLCNLAQVTKSWLEAVEREKNKRGYIQSLRLPFNKLANRWIEWEFQSFDTLPNLLEVIPFVSLLIYDKKSGKIGLYANILNNFRKNLPGKAIATIMFVKQFLTSTDVDLEDSNLKFRTDCDLLEIFIRRMKQENSNLKFRTDTFRTDRDLLGIFFQRMKQQIRTRVASCGELDSKCDLNLAVDRLAQELGLDDCECPKSVLLLFTTRRYGDSTLEAPFVACKLIRRLRNRIENGTETIWAGGFVAALFGSCYSGCHCKNCNDIVCNKSEHYQSLMVLRISGPTIESWCSTFNYYSSDSYLEGELNDLKKKVTPRRYCIGLFHALTYRSVNYYIMRFVKRVFPNIPWVGLFNKNSNVLLIDKILALPDDADPLDSVEDWYQGPKISIIIITYD